MQVSIPPFPAGNDPHDMHTSTGSHSVFRTRYKHTGMHHIRTFDLVSYPWANQNNGGCSFQPNKSKPKIRNLTDGSIMPRSLLLQHVRFSASALY